MIASLDVATKMMDVNGEVMMRDIIREAIQLRKEVARLNREFKAKKDWFFGMWQPRKVRIDGKDVEFADADIDYLADHQEPWVFSKDNLWHGFPDIEDNYVMLDPIKLTITTPELTTAALWTTGEFPLRS